MTKMFLILLLLGQPQPVSDDTLAWARHKTGFDQDDEFESVAKIPGSGGEDEVWVVVNRTINGVDYKFVEQLQPQDFGDQNDAWFVDAGIGPVSSAGEAETPATEIAATYTMTLISENASIWGIPVGDGVMIAGLDVSGVAVDLGGGLVGLPYAGHPFVAGETVRITATTNYNASEVLHASTSTNQLVITAGFTAETFDGTEIIVKHIGSLPGSGGRMAQDSDGNLYYAHDNTGTVPNVYNITKVETDGTLSPDYDWLNIAWTDITQDSRGIAITSDDAYLYLCNTKTPAATIYGYIHKFNLTTGDEEWVTTASFGVNNHPGYDMAIDTDGNAYGIGDNGKNVFKCASANGAITEIDLPIDTHALGGYAYDIEISDSQNKAVVVGREFIAVGWGPLLYNMVIMDLDGSNQVPILVGGYFENINIYFTPLIGTGGIAIDGDYIYVVTSVDGTTPTLFKYDFDGNLIKSAAAPTYAVGIYFDLYGNLVVVVQDGVQTITEILYFYDTELTSISSISGMYSSMLRTWDASVGGAWIQGNSYFDGTLEVPGNPLIPGVDPNYVKADHYPVDVNLCVYADGVPIGNYITEADANGTIVLNLGAEYDTVIAGINYYSIYETMPLIEAKARPSKLAMDFYETLGCNVGVNQEQSSNLTFSSDDFATRLDMVTDYKFPTFMHGWSADSTIYLWLWEPIPWTTRGMYVDMEIVK